MKDELLDFDTWCKEHCTSALSKGISLAIENYRKSDNSSGLNETRAVRQNEQQEKIFNDLIRVSKSFGNTYTWHLNEVIQEYQSLKSD